jgi:TonB family protein
VTKPAAVVKTVEAIYPPEALAEGLAADVTLTVDIDATGKATKIEVTRPAGHGFDEAATAALAQYQFSPAEVDGAPAPVRIEYTLHFIPNVVADAGAPPPAPSPPPPPVLVATGRVREKGTRDPLPDADVAIIVRAADGAEAPAEIVAGTDPDGRFQVKAPAGLSVRVVITDPSHEPCIRDLPPGREGGAPTEIDCLVARRPGAGNETVVKAAPPTEAVTRYELKQPELATVPGTFGDPLRVVQSLPGVARTPYGLGALIIRGSNPGDSGIFVEGHPIPLLYHFLVGPSVLTPRLIDRIDFFPGNFGVQYGRATAGVVDVAVKTDPAPRLHGVADMNLLDSSVYVEGPLGHDWSGSISARRSYIDLLLRAAATDTTLVAPAYYDYQAGLHRSFAGGKLSLFAFGSDDTLAVIDKDPNRGDIHLDTAIGFHKLIAGWVASAGGWVNKLSPALGYERQRADAGGVAINESAYAAELRDELLRAFTPALGFRIGFDGLARRDHLFLDAPIPPMTRLYGQALPMVQQRTLPFDSLDAALFSDLTWTPGHGVTVIPGVRGDLFHVAGQTRTTLDPRLVVRWQMRPTHMWKVGVGLFHQMPLPQELNAEFGNPNLPPIWADQYSAGFVHNLTSKLSLDTTLYYVRRHDLPLPPTPYTPDGRGRSYGMELILKHEFTDRFYGWLAYTLSRSEQTAYSVESVMLTAPGLQDPNARQPT